jgi:hypothetical protein
MPLKIVFFLVVYITWQIGAVHVTVKAPKTLNRMPLCLYDSADKMNLVAGNDCIEKGIPKLLF